MENLEEIIKQVDIDIENQFKINNEIEYKNSKKVLEAFKHNQVSEAHLNGTTGYGYNDIGRETIENILDDINLKMV